MWMGDPAWAPTGARAMPDRARHVSIVKDLTGGMRDMAAFLPPCLAGWSRRTTPRFTRPAPAGAGRQVGTQIRPPEKRTSVRRPERDYDRSEEHTSELQSRPHLA